MALLIDDRAVVEDAYAHLDDDAPMPLTGAVTVTWDRWQHERAALAKRPGKIGVRVPNTVEPHELAVALDGVSLVVIDFPKFTDGRGYSLARLLREQHGYRGRLRAAGDVMRDQIFNMARCGFDQFSLKAGKDPHDALRAFDEFTVTCQPDARGGAPIWKRRRPE
ncbi:MAG: DUF934 domain-containing protein [Myxococcales bacterium]|nr:DUF934 domain-containing protein [Myxococcales bacterium]